MFIAEDARGPRGLYLSSKKKARRWATWGFYGGKFDGAAAELEEGCATAETEHLDPESFCRHNAKDHVATLARLRLIRASSGNLPSTVICFLYLSFTTRAFGYSFLLPKFPRDCQCRLQASSSPAPCELVRSCRGRWWAG